MFNSSIKYRPELILLKKEIILHKNNNYLMLQKFSKFNDAKIFENKQKKRTNINFNWLQENEKAVFFAKVTIVQNDH